MTNGIHAKAINGKLWHVYAIESEPEWRNPWDMALGFVIRAETEHEARTLASLACGDEGKDVWMLQAKSVCIELTGDGYPIVVLRDFNAG
jgi:hypothetical protein